MTRPVQELHEQEVFRHFAEAKGLSLIPGTLESRKPPEPDLYCEIDGIGPVTVELTELIDERYMDRLGLMFHTKEFLTTQLLDTFPAEVQKDFREKYSNALVHFGFVDSLNLAQRKRAAVKAAEILLHLEDGIIGNVNLRGTELAGQIQSLRIGRGRFNGPMFDVASFGWLGNPLPETIRGKLQKPYQTNSPLWLLAYVETNLLPPDGVWQASAEEVAGMLPDSQFDRLFIFDRSTEAVIYEAE